MNLNELAAAVRQVSPEKTVQDLAQLLLEWKTDTQTVEALSEQVEKYLGNTWITPDEDYEKIYRLWSAFRDNTVDTIGSMTMNERLYYFGLLDNFDADDSPQYRSRLYHKLHATP